MPPKYRKIIRIGAGLGAFLCLALVVGLWSDYFARKKAGQIFPSLEAIETSLPSTKGARFAFSDLRGQPSAIFFGFTHCPEICPVTLYDLSTMAAAMGAAERLQIVFITVDPARDSLAVLGEYIGAINAHAIGLSGDAESHRAIEKAFRVYSQKIMLDDGGLGDGGDDGDYTMDHTATVYLYDAEGDFYGTIAWGEPEEFVRAKMTALLRS